MSDDEQHFSDGGYEDDDDGGNDVDASAFEEVVMPTRVESTPKVDPGVSGQMAVMLKDQGNDKFRAGDYESALRCYTIACEHDDTNDVVFNNMAMCCLKIENWTKALEYADKALTLSKGKNGKAWYRRGRALLQLNRIREGFYDFQRALIMEPTSAEVRRDLTICRADLVKIDPDWHESRVRTDDPYWLSAADADPEVRKLFVEL